MSRREVHFASTTYWGAPVHMCPDRLDPREEYLRVLPLAFYGHLALTPEKNMNMYIHRVSKFKIMAGCSGKNTQNE